MNYELRIKNYVAGIPFTGKLRNKTHVLFVTKISFILYFPVGILVTLFFILNSAPTVHAQGISLGIAPPIIQIDAKAPADIKTPITIENGSDETVVLDMQLKAFTANQKENGHVQYFKDSDPASKPPIFHYIQLLENDHVQTRLTLAPQQKKTVVLHIGIPKDTPKDDTYFSVIFVSTTDDQNISSEYRNTQNSSQTPVGIATNILLSIGPKGKPTGEILEFSTPFFRENGPVPFTLRLKNTSDHMIAPRGEIMIRNMFNQIIGRIDLLPVNVLAHTIRAIPDSLQSPEATGSANFKFQSASWPTNFKFPTALWYEEFLLGPYTATLTMALSEQGPVFRRSISFFAMPLSILISIILCIIILTYLVIRVRKRMKQKI